MLLGFLLEVYGLLTHIVFTVSMAASSDITTDHKKIKEWTLERNGFPTQVKGTGDKGGGIIRIDFEGYSGEKTLEEISWEDFFEVFEEKNLAFLYQDKTADGKLSRFFKFVARK